MLIADHERPVADVGAQARAHLLEGLPVTERRIELAGIPTGVLEGGEGPPLLLLHGPGEFAPKWLRVIPRLVGRWRVIAPDLPAHGASGTGEEPLDEARVLAWLDALISETCDRKPVLLGHVLGGAIAARYAIDHGERLERLVLVDSLGLARFRPAPGFALALLALQARPSERAHLRFMRHCSADLDQLRTDLGERWESWASYSLQLARSPQAKAMGALMRGVGLPRIPEAELARITIPTDLIWGREDEANRLRIAETTAERHNWPLHVIDDCADDPARDRPDAFVDALHAAVSR